jgi:predicted nuclease of predicted toxin-antitoxin system
VRALLDEHLSAQVAVMLRQAGDDVLAVAERGDLVGRGDRDIFQIATREGRAVVTNNVKDFRPLAAQWLAEGKSHAGLILLPSARTRNRSATPALAKAIGQILRANPDGISGSERWIGPVSDW